MSLYGAYFVPNAVDPSGRFLGTVIGLVVGAVVGGVIDGWPGVIGGAVTGALIGSGVPPAIAGAAGGAANAFAASYAAAEDVCSAKFGLRMSVNIISGGVGGGLAGGLTETITTKFGISIFWMLVTKEATVTFAGEWTQEVAENYFYDIPVEMVENWSDLIQHQQQGTLINTTYGPLNGQTTQTTTPRVCEECPSE